MEQIDELLAESMITIFINDHLPSMDGDTNVQNKIEELKANTELRNKTSNELLALISAQIEFRFLETQRDIQSALNIIIQTAYLYSRAFESKLGGVSNLYKALVANYNKNRT